MPAGIHPAADEMQSDCGRRQGLRWLRAGCLAISCVVGACGGGSGPSTPTTQQPPQPPAGLVALPGNPATFALQVFPAAGRTSQWCVFRGWPDERLYVFSQCDSASPRAATFTRAAQGGLLLAGVADGGARLALVTYDAERTVPSGRTSGPVVDGVDVLLFSAPGVAEPVRIAELLPFGAFDLIYAAAQSNGLVVCAVDSCFSVRDDGTATQWQSAAMSGYEFVEALVSDRVEAIVRRRDDHVTGDTDAPNFHYAAATLYPDHAEVRPIAADCIPFALTAGATWRCARTRSEIADLLRSEIARMPNGGMMDFGTSNLEGRVAWSQVYYLTGLMQLDGDALPALQASGQFPGLRARLRAEIELLGMRLSSPDALVSKRYSMQRTAVTFALHVGRTARLLRTAADTGHGSSSVQAARALLQARLRSLNGTVEQPIQAAQDGVTFATIGYARGADFWCDGANVPYNYISGVVDGLLAVDDVTGADLDRAAALMRPLLTLEPLAGATQWRYWWSRGSDGWSTADDISTNTSSYVGNPGVSHITYRSMDAVALLRLNAEQPGSVPAQVVANLRSLTAAGALLPWVNEALPAAARVTLQSAIAYRHARSAAPWELQSQVWALERLAQDAPP